MTRPAVRPRVGAAERREQLIDAAADIVSAAGVDALTMEAVVAKLGVHRPIVYRHFANAEMLLDAVVERELGVLRESTEKAVDGVVGFEARMHAAVSVWMEQFARSAGLMSIGLVRPPSNDALRAHRREQNRRSMAFIVREFGAEGVTGADAEIAGAALLHALVGIVQLWGQRRITRKVAIDRYVRIASATLEALRPQSD
jgi:AcrR family transcriptional regulator